MISLENCQNLASDCYQVPAEKKCKKFILTVLPDLELMLQVYHQGKHGQHYLEREKTVLEDTQVYGHLPPRGKKLIMFITW